MGEWRDLPIKQLGRVITGATPKSSEPDSWGDEIDFITPTDQREGFREARAARRLSSVGAERLSSRIVPAGSTCFTCIGATIGKTSLTTRPAVTNQQINSVIPNPASTDCEFLYYLLTYHAADIARIASGSATPIVNKSQFENFVVRVPSVATQKAIGRILGALDDKIAINERIMTTSHELAQALAARVLADSPRVPLAEIATITMGSSPPGHTYNDAGIGMPFYQGARDFGSRFPKRRVWCTEPVRLAQPGSTLVSVRAPVGRLNVAIEQCCIGRGLAALTSKNQTPSVLFHTLSFASEIWQPFESEGTVFGAINKAQLEGLLVPALDPPSCHELEATLSSLDDLVRQRFMENATLAELRDTLLPKLISGELRVRDAEKAVEEAL